MTELWDDQIADLERQIAEVRANRDAVKSALRESVQPEWKYVLVPVSLTMYGEECWDETIVGYRLNGVITNKEECESVGWSANQLTDGGMTYIFNKGTGKFVMPTGGGRVYIQTRGTFATEEQVEHAHLTLDRLAAFVALYPEGGDVTEIVAEHVDFRKTR